MREEREGRGREKKRRKRKRGIKREGKLSKSFIKCWVTKHRPDMLLREERERGEEERKKKKEKGKFSVGGLEKEEGS